MYQLSLDTNTPIAVLSLDSTELPFSVICLKSNTVIHVTKNLYSSFSSMLWLNLVFYIVGPHFKAAY